MDRFIINRNLFNVDVCNEKLHAENKEYENDYNSELKKILLNDYESILPFNNLKKNKSNKKILLNKNPKFVISARGYINDFYSNNLDWSSLDVITLGIRNIVYYFDEECCALKTLIEDKHNITAVKWNDEGTLLSVGNFIGEFFIFDLTNFEILFHVSLGHKIYSISYINNLFVVCSMNKIIFIDYRNKIVQKISVFEGRVCSIEFNDKYFASGHEDNVVCIWDNRNLKDYFNFIEHNSSVKAIKWSPNNNYEIVTGGGTNDKKIIISNVNNNDRNIINANSQVTSLIWSKNNPEQIVSSHGFSDNTIKIWDIKNKNNILNLENPYHKTRILGMCQHSKNDTIVSISSNDLLVMWDFYSVNKKVKEYNFTCIR